MRNLRIWQKLLVMGAVFMVPFAVVTYTMVSSINTIGRSSPGRKSEGSSNPRPSAEAAPGPAGAPGHGHCRLSGDASFKERLATKGADIENDIRKIDEVDQRLDARPARWQEVGGPECGEPGAPDGS